MENKDLKNSKVILSIENLKKYFINQGNVNKAVDGVSFDLHEGEIVGLIGESGSGKTTVGRTILRLYEDFNGFIRLNGKIISGKNISYKRRKYLRRNVQMIFQDPHASLNGQQPIYNILKEPLLVNGVIKEKINDIFKDWKDVKENFKYTFQIRVMQLELENYKTINKLAKPHFEKWQKIFNDFSFKKEISNEDNFSAFYGYLEEKQQVESLIINNMYSNTTDLINFYYEKQRDFRNHNISPLEDKYLKAKSILLKTLELAKISPEKYQALEEYRKVGQEYAKFKEEIKEFCNTSANTFINYIQEYKNELMLSDIARYLATDLDFYLYNYKNVILYKFRKNVLKNIKSQCKYLDFESIRQLVKDLDEYSKEFYTTRLEKIPYQRKVKKIILTETLSNFNFDASKYIKLSKQQQDEYAQKINEYKAKLEEIKKEISEAKKPENIQETYLEAKQKLQEAEEQYIVERSNFLISYKEKIKELYKELQEEKFLYKKLVDIQTECNNKFQLLKPQFFEFLESQIVDEKSKEEIKSFISIYKSDLFIKEETMKSFDIEKKYLLKDINNIYLLLGIDYKWVEKNIKFDLMANENSDDNTITNNRKWSKRTNLYDFSFFKPIAKWRIAQLLYKITIYKALEDVGLLKQFAYRYPHEFSGGQLQRIVIARALIIEPKVIVADEPIASLDISIQAQVVNLLKELCRKKNIGLIFIAHDLSMIEYVADNVQIMHLGKIVEHGKTEAIYEKPYHPYTINLFKAIPKISNANEKFQNVSFELDYLNEQQFPNVPEMFKISNEHYVYGTKTQVDEWKSNANKKNNGDKN
ncbi:ATP-binding cassette domain-containing protein [Metamycoplasma buccale]|uniref:ATP-binding cassette domain-containing protein n=1 Tax=Metamycoplasma buccale TaxID=55602 RepID=UPI00398EA70E